MGIKTLKLPNGSIVRYGNERDSIKITVQI